MDSINKTIKNVKNFPHKGILFRDLTPILYTPKIFNLCIDKLKSISKKYKFDVIVAPEARGFWFAAPLAYELNKPFVPARKPNKLPRKTIGKKFVLEYAETTIQIHKDDIKPHSKVLLVDDVIATGGTLKALTDLLKQINCEVVAILSIAEITALNAHKLFPKNIPIHSLVKF